MKPITKDMETMTRKSNAIRHSALQNMSVIKRETQSVLRALANGFCSTQDILLGVIALALVCSGSRQVLAVANRCYPNSSWIKNYNPQKREPLVTSFSRTIMKTK